MDINKKDLFKTDIFNSSISPPNSSSFSLIGSALPTNQDLYFMSKWHEIFSRYQSARIFLREANKDSLEDWEHWFSLSGSEDDELFKLMFISEMYETSLINYNILVDLSWTFTYVSAEYVLYKFDEKGNILNSSETYGMMPIDQAWDALRNMEGKVTTPTAQNNPFGYLKIMRPEFCDSIDLIIDFWNQFSNSNIRNMYNYIKHKGKPIYKEINDYNPTRFFGLKIGNDDYPSDIRDIQKIVNLFDGINELIEFDDNKLFPYLIKLIEELKIAVNPSPYIL